MTLAELHQHRLAGRRPNFQLFLTLVPELHGDLREQAISVSLCDDFAALTGLSVWVCFRSTQIESALTIVDKVLVENPFDLILWDVDRGWAENIVEHGTRTTTRAVPDETLRPIMENLKCN